LHTLLRSIKKKTTTKKTYKRFVEVYIYINVFERRRRFGGRTEHDIDEQQQQRKDKEYEYEEQRRRDYYYSYRDTREQSNKPSKSIELGEFIIDRRGFHVGLEVVRGESDELVQRSVPVDFGNVARIRRERRGRVDDDEC
tara:strand:- start:1189 stop:1608 length:420 start_codon:yes stop_codon:yes gene_type:complete